MLGSCLGRFMAVPREIFQDHISCLVRQVLFWCASVRAHWVGRQSLLSMHNGGARLGRMAPARGSGVTGSRRWTAANIWEYTAAGAARLYEL